MATGTLAWLPPLGRPNALHAFGRPACATAAAGHASESRDEDALMQAVASGDAGAYRVLAERYLSPIVRYAARILGSQDDAEDVAQETFLRLWQQAGRYESRGHKPSTWLFRIAHNLCVDRLRQRRPTAQQSPDESAAADRPSLELQTKQLAVTVQAALDALPERQRAAIALVHYEGVSHAEAAAVLECGVEAVESLLSRARRALRAALAETAAERLGEHT